jgi:galactokinase
MTGKELLNQIDTPQAEILFTSLYGEGEVDSARRRYCHLIEGLLQDFSPQEFPEISGQLRLFSVPGRSELGGNHTDHNRGKVLAASIQLDAIAIVAPRQDKQVFFRSVGHPDVRVDISDLSLREEERGNTEALVRGIAAEFAARATPVGGFIANAANSVLTGSGLSSSAAVEVLFGKIFDNLYAGGKRSALELAKIGQKAENLYFGKPCGLMDQTACASGGVVAIDFEDLQNPHVRGIGFDPADTGFALCVVDTRGTHADLTPDYAAIPMEMKAVAAFFGKTVLRELNKEMFLSRLPDLRKAVGDRAILRALHFFNENRLVDAMLAALGKLNALPLDSPPETKSAAMETFLGLVRESGDSSWELLQNIYSPKNPGEQGISLALALTRNFLRSNNGACNDQRQGACRVHGGGFAGTIQAYLPLDRLEDYRELMEGIFGKGALTVLRIRPQGAIEINFQ